MLVLVQVSWMKTSRAGSICAWFRAGELQGVWVPNADHEARRELIRGRQTAMQEVRRSRQLVHGGRIPKTLPEISAVLSSLCLECLSRLLYSGPI